MCAEGRPDEAHGNARVFAGRVSDAYLVRGDIGQPGYTIVIWRGSHIADLTELTDSDATTYLREVLKVARALEAPEDLVACPAQWLRRAAGRVVVVADSAAASEL